MSRKAKQKKNENLGRKFRIYVKPVDDCGFPDESRFGWVSYTRENGIDTCSTWRNAIIFEEKEDGHGSFEDWKKFFESEYKDWRILNGPNYLSEDEEQ